MSDKPYAEHLRTEEVWCSGLTETLKALGFTDAELYSFWNDNTEPRLLAMRDLGDAAIRGAIQVNENRKRISHRQSRKDRP